MSLQIPPTGEFTGFPDSPFENTIAGGTAVYQLTITALNGFSGAVTFSAAKLPTGATASFSPTTVSGSGTTQLTISTAASTPTGTYPFTVTAQSGSIVHIGAFALNVGPPGTIFGDFVGTVTPTIQYVLTVTP